MNCFVNFLAIDRFGEMILNISIGLYSRVGFLASGEIGGNGIVGAFFGALLESTKAMMSYLRLISGSV